MFFSSAGVAVTHFDFIEIQLRFFDEFYYYTFSFAIPSNIEDWTVVVAIDEIMWVKRQAQKNI